MEDLTAASHLPAFSECLSETCRFRFPVLNIKELRSASTCPRCGSPTLLSEVRQPAAATRQSISGFHPLHHVEVLVDNIRSAYNVGSIFRVSDGAGIKHIHLCGLSSTPVQSAVLKTSLGAEKQVPWTYHSNAKFAAIDLKDKGYQTWALETGGDSGSIFEMQFPSRKDPLLLVVGNEVSGIDPAILKLCEKRLWIPMSGVKGSLNVASAFSIAAYTLCWHLHL